MRIAIINSEDIKVSSILVTGAFGNMGPYIIHELLTRGHNVIAADIKNSATSSVSQRVKKRSQHLPGVLTLKWIDLRQETTLEPLFIENRLSGIIHLAFIIPPFSELTPDLAKEVNVEGTQRMIKFTTQYAEKASFLFGSSVATFGTVNSSNPPLSLSNTQPTPTNNYTSHKITCEDLVKQSALNWRILRFSVVMNPTFRPSKESLKYSRRVPLETKVEPVHVKDLAIAVCNALNNPTASRRTFIIAGGEKNRTTYRDYIFRSMNAYLGNIKEDQIPWQKFSEDPYYLHWYDTTESEKLLKFQKRTIEDYLKDMRESIPFWQRIMLPISKKTALKILFL